MRRDLPPVAPPTFGQDPAPAAWIRSRLTGAWGSVTGTVPEGYDAYARLLHPVESDDGEWSWAHVAADTGATIHPLVQWHRLCGVANEDAMDVTAEWRPLRSALAIGQHVLAPHGTWFAPQSPNLCWPDDRAWFVASEIDFDSTLVAGTRTLVNELVAHHVLEAVEIAPGDLLTATADTIN